MSYVLKQLLDLIDHLQESDLVELAKRRPKLAIALFIDQRSSGSFEPSERDARLALGLAVKIN